MGGGGGGGGGGGSDGGGGDRGSIKYLTAKYNSISLQ